MARLITGGVDHGVHAFILPLRDPLTYQPLPGRIMGDIGPKVGYESNDNGEMRGRQSERRGCGGVSLVVYGGAPRFDTHLSLFFRSH